MSKRYQVSTILRDISSASDGTHPLPSEDEDYIDSQREAHTFSPEKAAELQARRIKVGGALLAGQGLPEEAHLPEYADLLHAFTSGTPDYIYRYVPLGRVLGWFGRGMRYGYIPAGDEHIEPNTITGDLLQKNGKSKSIKKYNENDHKILQKRKILKTRKITDYKNHFFLFVELEFEPSTFIS